MLGIDIKVDSKQVKDAKQHIDMLNRSLNDTNALGDLTIGEDGLPLASQRLKDMAEQVRRLQALSRQGTSKGGVLDPQQFKEAQEHMRRLNGSVQDYAKTITSVRNEMNQLVKAQAEMRRKGESGSGDFKANRERIRQLQEERKELEAQEQQIRRMGAQGSNAANDITNMRQNQSGGGMSGLKKALGFALAAAGVGGPLAMMFGFLSKSRATYQQAIGHESTLGARGITGGYGDNIDIGMGPLEQMALLESISQNTGMSGRIAQKTARTAGLFGRYTGTSPEQIASLYGTAYQATGKESSADSTINVMGKAMERGLKTAKVPELLQVVTRNTQLTAQAMGGAALSEKQMNMASAWSAFAMMQKDSGLSHFAKSQTFGNILQNGFQGAGNPAGELLLFKALGGFDGRMDMKKLFKMEQLREEGPMMHPELLSKMLGSMGGDAEDKSVMLKKWFPQWGLSTKSAMDLQQLMGKSSTFKQIQELGSQGGEIPKELQEKWKKEVEALPGMSKQAIEAQREQQHLEAGEKINRILGSLEDAALGIGKSILGSQNAEQLIKALESTTASINAISKWFTDPSAATTDKAKSSIYRAIDDSDKANGSVFIPQPLQVAFKTAKILKDGFSGSNAGDGNQGHSAISDFWQRTKDRFGFKDTSALKSKAAFYASKYGVEPRLFQGLIEQESQWNPNAVSKTGAVGLGQLTASAGHYKKGKDNPFDPDFNLDKSAKHFSYLLKKYKGNSQKALAAYNAGDGTVDLASKKYGPRWLSHMNEFKYGQDAQGHVRGALKYAGMQESSEPNEPPQMASSHDAQTITLDLMLKELRLMNANMSRFKLAPSHSRT